MPYDAIANAAQDGDLKRRVAACIAEQTTGLDDPESLAQQRIWRIAAEPGWADAYASALAAGNTRPGLDPAVVTDAMILAAVQKHLGAP